MGKPGSEVLCPKPFDEVMSKVKNDKNAKAGEKWIIKKKRAQGEAPLNADAIVIEGTITVVHSLAIDQDVVQPLAIEQEAEEKNVKIV